MGDCRPDDMGHPAFIRSEVQDPGVSGERRVDPKPFLVVWPTHRDRGQLNADVGHGHSVRLQGFRVERVEATVAHHADTSLGFVLVGLFIRRGLVAYLSDPLY